MQNHMVTLMTIQDKAGACASVQAQEARRQLGWCDYYERLLQSEYAGQGQIVRVLSAQRNQFLVSDGLSEWMCAPAGRLLHNGATLYPVTGDWVLVEEGLVLQVLPRKTMLCRGGAGSRGRRSEAAVTEQPIGANIDTVFIVCGLDRDYNLRRIERYLALVYNCGITPVIVLTKADIHDVPQSFRDEVEAIAFGVPVVLSAITDDYSVDELAPFLRDGKTVAMLGSSGAGKSTLANLLHGNDIRQTGAVSESVGKGKHTTTTRELIRMPQGGMLMDNPGIREIALFTDGDGLSAAFPEIQVLAAACRFGDCTHTHEPGCAVRQAVERGELDAGRLESYRKMWREMEYAAARSERSADRVEKERWKDVTLAIRRMKQVKHVK